MDAPPLITPATVCDTGTSPVDTTVLYRQRFSDGECREKHGLWSVLVRSVLQRYVKPSDTVLDLGGGFCEFINLVQAGRKYVADVNPAVVRYAERDVQVVPIVDGRIVLQDGACDVVFASNVFEHLHHTAELFDVLKDIRRVLAPAGRLLVLQPNIRYAYREYWDFIDHHLPLSHRSLGEALQLAGFVVRECRPRFLPYSTKGCIPKWPVLLWLYLHLPLCWPVFGKQMFMMAESRGGLVGEAEGCAPLRPAESQIPSF